MKRFDKRIQVSNTSSKHQHIDEINNKYNESYQKYHAKLVLESSIPKTIGIEYIEVDILNLRQQLCIH